MICRQTSNGAKRRGQKTGPQKGKTYKKRLNRGGYFMMYAGNHPFAEGRKMAPEHVMIMELRIQRRLRPDECVHHINGIKTDNRLENLELQIHAEHSRTHAKHSAQQRKRIRGRFA